MKILWPFPFYLCAILFFVPIIAPLFPMILLALLLSLGVRHYLSEYQKRFPKISSSLVLFIASLFILAVFFLPIFWLSHLFFNHFNRFEKLLNLIPHFLNTIPQAPIYQTFKEFTFLHFIFERTPLEWYQKLQSSSLTLTLTHWLTPVLLNSFSSLFSLLFFFFLFLLIPLPLLLQAPAPFLFSQIGSMFLAFHVQRQRELFLAIFNGIFVVGFVEGLTFWALCALCHVPQSAFLGLMLGFLTAIPTVAPMLILFIALGLWLSSSFPVGLTFLSLAYLIIFVIDPILRTTPSKKLHLHGGLMFLMIFLSIPAFGLAGLFIGPALLLLIQDLITSNVSMQHLSNQNSKK